MFLTFVRPAYEYGLALGGFRPSDVKELARIQACSCTAIVRWNAVNVAAALLGIAGTFQRAQELQARFLVRMMAMGPDTLAHHLLLEFGEGDGMLPGSVLDILQKNPIWMALADGRKISDEDVRRWGREERALWAHSADAVKMLPADRRPDISVISPVDRPTSRALIAWRMGALTPPHRFCVATGHRLTRHAAAECVDADIRVAAARQLRLPPTLAVPGTVWAVASIIDKVFMTTTRRVWKRGSIELQVLVPILSNVQVQCNGLRPWA